jgi:predicted ATPase
VIGTLLDGRYRLLSLLGSGGMSDVYEAWDEGLRRAVAVKVLNAGQDDAEDERRFEREFHSLATLSHPALLSVYDFGSIDGRRFLVSEILRGRTLAELIEQGRFPASPTSDERLDITTEPPGIPELGLTPSIELVVGILDRLADALGYLHELSLVHRDIKPSNVMLLPGGSVKLMDFGLIRSLGSSTNLTQAGRFVGTAAYISPEQARGLPLDGRADLYSLGCVAYELLTGRRPFEGDNAVDIVVAHLTTPVMPLRRVNPHVPEPLESVIMRLLEKDRGGRFADAADLRRALEAAVRLVAPSAEPLPPALQALRARRPGSVFVGRTTELDVLTTVVDRAVQGQGGVALVRGEAGIGKSRLLRELRDRLRSRRVAVFDGRCSPTLREPYQPFTELLEKVVRTLPGLGNDRHEAILGGDAAALRCLLPFVDADLFLLESGGTPERRPSEVLALPSRDSLLDGVAGVLERLSWTVPCVLFLEDLHWADDSALYLLCHLARRLPSLRIAILATLRDEDLVRGDTSDSVASRLLEEVAQLRECVTVSLGSLGAIDIAEMVRSLLGGELGSARLESALRDVTEGNPLFVQEVIRSLRESGELVRKGAAWQWHGGDLLLPTRVRDVIRRRINRLDPDAREVLNWAAAIGRELPRSILAQCVADLPGLDMDRALAVLLEAQLLREEQRPGEKQYAFAHALIQKIVHDELSRERRHTLHTRIAAAVEVRAAALDIDASAELAGHYAETNEHAHALRYALRAADRARALHAHARALAFCRIAEDALNALESTATDRAAWADQRFEILRAMRRLHRLAGETSAALARAEERLELARALGRDAEEASALNDRGVTLWFAGDTVRALEDITHARVMWERMGNTAQVASSLANEGELHLCLGHLKESARADTAAIRLASRTDQQAATRALMHMGNTLHVVGHFDRALRCQTVALRRWRALGDDVEMARSLINIGNVRAARGQLAAARRAYEQSLLLLTAVAARHDESLVHVNMAEILLDAGEWSRAEHALRSAESAVERSGEPGLMPRVRSLRLLLRVATGRLGEVERFCTDGANATDTSLDIEDRAFTRLALAEGWCALGELARARAEVEPLRDPPFAYLVASRPRVERVLGQIDAARSATPALLARLLRSGERSRTRGDRREVIRLGVLSGQVALALDRTTEAENLLRRAARAAERIGMRPTHVQAAVALSCLVRDDARLAAQAALEAAHQAGTTEDVQEAALVLGEVESRYGASTLAWAHLRAAVQAVRSGVRELSTAHARDAYRLRRGAFLSRLRALFEKLREEPEIRRWSAMTGERELASWLAEIDDTVPSASGG